MNERNHMLITGEPGIGKTTLIMNLCKELKDMHPAGFYTAEKREAGIRSGFELLSLNGIRGILAHVDISSPFRVSKYGVDVEGFESFLDAITSHIRTASIIIIDEIGKMECFSTKFRSLIMDIINSDRILIATIALKGGGMIADVKKRHDVKLFRINLENRNLLVSEILHEIKDIGERHVRNHRKNKRSTNC